MTTGEPVIRVGDTEYRPSPDRPVTFGRGGRCTVRFGVDDMAISRRAGSIICADGIWWLTNDSRSRPLAVVDQVGLRTVLAPGRRTAIEGRLRVIVAGTGGSHELVIESPVPPARLLTTTGSDLSTSVGEGVVLNDADRDALVALFAGYLYEGKAYDPHPKTYAAAAARLNVPRTTLVKRIEYVRARLEKSGVPNMTGWNALSDLAEYVLTAGIITRDDLRRIKR